MYMFSVHYGMQRQVFHIEQAFTLAARYSVFNIKKFSKGMTINDLVRGPEEIKKINPFLNF